MRWANCVYCFLDRLLIDKNFTLNCFCLVSEQKASFLSVSTSKNALFDRKYNFSVGIGLNEFEIRLMDVMGDPDRWRYHFKIFRRQRAPSREQQPVGRLKAFKFKQVSCTRHWADICASVTGAVVRETHHKKLVFFSFQKSAWLRKSRFYGDFDGAEISKACLWIFNSIILGDQHFYSVLTCPGDVRKDEEDYGDVLALSDKLFRIFAEFEIRNSTISLILSSIFTNSVKSYINES